MNKKPEMGHVKNQDSIAGGHLVSMRRDNSNRTLVQFDSDCTVYFPILF